MATRYLNLLTFPLYRSQNEYQKRLRAGEGAKRVFAFLDENRTESTDGHEFLKISSTFDS